MKHLFITLFLLAVCATLPAQSRQVTFKFQDGINEGATRTSIENNLSKLLTEINQACIDNRPLRLSGINIESGAKDNLEMLWQNLHFYCEDATNIQPCLNATQGYQVRSIPITIRPVADYTGKTERELSISMTRTGTLTGVRVALEMHSVAHIMRDGAAIKEAAERMEILKFVEDFRCYYNNKNWDALENIYADDALIIKGSVLKKGGKGAQPEDQTQVKYITQNKEQYMNDLRRVFARNRFIDVEFDKIEVVRNGANGMQDFYGVTLHQKWNSSTYSDEGWLFLYWDFRDRENPKIHVRTWQPNQSVGADGEGVFDMHDFFITSQGPTKNSN